MITAQAAEGHRSGFVIVIEGSCSKGLKMESKTKSLRALSSKCKKKGMEVISNKKENY